MACLLFITGGDLSSGSSVRLKSPSTNSGLGRFFALLSRSICAQNVGCSLTLFSAYIFTMVTSLLSDHFILIIIALPCFSTCVLTLIGASSALFIRKATPADPCGFSESLELKMSKLFPKHRWMSFNRPSSRWVSCRANIAILSVLMVLFIKVHFSMWSIFWVGAAAPFIFSDAIFIFARFFMVFRSLFSLGVGLSLFGWFSLPAALCCARGGVWGAGVTATGVWGAGFTATGAWRCML